MKMRKLNIRIFLVILGLIAGNIALAQPQNRPQAPPPIPGEEQMVEMFEHLSSELALNEEQKNQLSEVFQMHFSIAREKLEQNRQNQVAHREEMESLRQNFEKDVNAVLTDEQQKQYAEIQKNLHPPREEMPAFR